MSMIDRGVRAYGAGLLRLMHMAPDDLQVVLQAESETLRQEIALLREQLAAALARLAELDHRSRRSTPLRESEHAQTWAQATLQTQLRPA